MEQKDLQITIEKIEKLKANTRLIKQIEKAQEEIKKIKKQLINAENKLNALVNKLEF